jgi:hypothetical protein
VALLRRRRTDEPAEECHGMNNVGEEGHTHAKVTTIKEAQLIG